MRAIGFLIAVQLTFLTPQPTILDALGMGGVAVVLVVLAVMDVAEYIRSW